MISNCRLIVVDVIHLTVRARRELQISPALHKDGILVDQGKGTSHTSYLAMEKFPQLDIR